MQLAVALNPSENMIHDNVFTLQYHVMQRHINTFHFVISDAYIVVTRIKYSFTVDERVGTKNERS